MTRGLPRTTRHARRICAATPSDAGRARGSRLRRAMAKHAAHEAAPRNSGATSPYVGKRSAPTPAPRTAIAVSSAANRPSHAPSVAPSPRASSVSTRYRFSAHPHTDVPAPQSAYASPIAAVPEP